MNYKIKLFVALTIMLISLISVAQDKVLTAEDAIYMNREIYPASVSQLQWIGESNNYAYASGNAFYKVGAKSGTETLLFDMDMINKAMANNSYDSIRRLPRVSFPDNNSCNFSSKHNYYNYNFVIGEINWLNSLDEAAENIEIENDSRFIAYTKDNNVFISIDGKVEQLTKDENPDIINGQAVHRVEFGISKGLFWSPESKKLAYYRMDETMVTDYPLVDINSRIAEVENTKYPMAGMTSHEVTLMVYDLENEKTTAIKTEGPADQFLTAVTWDPNGEFIYIGILNREQNHLKLNKYDANTGEFVAQLFEEKNSKYVEPEDGLYFLKSNKDHFIWISERDGWNHMYLYNTKGEMIKQLTSGNWIVTQFIGEFPGDQIWFKGTKESPLEQNAYKVKIDSDINTTRII